MQGTTAIALVGSGFMAKVHSHAYRNAARFFELERTPVLELIVGRDAAAREAARSRLGWNRGAGDWRAAIADPAVQLVDLAVPTDLHAELAIAAARAGKHVLCEKPLAMTAAAAREMLAVAESAGIRHAVAFNYRFLPAVALARKLIAEGRLGRIRHWRARYLQDWLHDAQAPASWRLDAARAGYGAHGDLNSHIVDLALWLVGPIAEVVGDSRTFVDRRPDGRGGEAAVSVDDATTFLARFQGGAMGTFEASRFATGAKNRNVFEIEGERGALRFNLERLNELELFLADEPAEIQGFRTVLATEPEHPFAGAWWPPGHVLGWEHSHTHLIAGFLRAIETGAPFAPDFSDGLRCQLVLDAVAQSVASGRWEAVAGIA